MDRSDRPGNLYEVGTWRGLSRLHTRLVDDAVRMALILGPVALTASLSRYLAFGWQPTFDFQIAAYGLVVLSFVLRARLSTEARFVFFLAAPFVAGVGGLVSFGLAGSGPLFLLATAILAFVFLGLRVGRIVVGINMTTLFAFAWAARSDLLPIVDTMPYATSWSGWAMAAAVLGLTGGVCGATVLQLQSTLSGTLESYESMAVALEEANESLIAEAVERAQAEAETRDLQKRLNLSLAKVLSGYVTICANCKQIRGESGTGWTSVEEYIDARTDASFSHTICEGCMTELYPDFTR